MLNSMYVQALFYLLARTRLKAKSCNVLEKLHKTFVEGKVEKEPPHKKSSDAESAR